MPIGRIVVITFQARVLCSDVLIVFTVRAAYGISWMYLLGDVSYETYKAKVRGPSKLEAINGLDDNLRLSLVFVKRST